MAPISRLVSASRRMDLCRPLDEFLASGLPAEILRLREADYHQPRAGSDPAGIRARDMGLPVRGGVSTGMTDTRTSRKEAAPASDSVGESSRVFAAVTGQVGEARRFAESALGASPLTSDAVLCISELAANACLHSASRLPGGTFTVRVLTRESVRIEVTDDGGYWARRTHGDARPHGLKIVAAVASESGISGGPQAGWLIWATLRFPTGQAPASEGNTNERGVADSADRA